MATALSHPVAHLCVPSNSDNIDISTLKTNILYQQSQCNPDHASQEIIAILGGINKILTDFLTSNDIKLTKDQLIKLQNTLNSHNLIVSDPKSKTENVDQLTYTFNINDTYHHYFFGNEIGSKIVHYVYSKIALIAFTFVLMLKEIWVFLQYLGNQTLNTSWYLCILSVNTLIFIYIILFTLCINKTVFIRSIKHFVFWFKTIITVEQIICYFILKYLMNNHGNDEISYADVISDILVHLSLVLCIMNYSAIDGHHVNKRLMITAGIIVSVYHAVTAVLWSLFANQDEMTIVTIGPLQISIASLYASALRTLSIFLCKQTILLILKKDKCVNIRHSPKIKWVDDDMK